MTKDIYSEAFDIVQHFMGSSSHYNPVSLAEQLGISVITDKVLRKDGYLICSDGLKLVFVSANIQNRHRQVFVVAHEIGHFLMHQNQLYCCSNISFAPSATVNTSLQEKEANVFATELLAPLCELIPLLPNRSLQLSDISLIANYFDISLSHAAIKCIQNSKSENEVLLCYQENKLKWSVTKGSYEFRSHIPARCPIDVYNTTKAAYVKGIWDDLYDGSVYQEVFHPYKNKTLILLSGNMIDWEPFNDY